MTRKHGPRLTIVGDLLLDRDLHGRAARISPDAPVPVVDRIEALDRPGGAGLAALLAAADGAAVTLVAALADDAAGLRVRRLLEAAGIEVVESHRITATPVKMRVRVDGQSLLRIDLGDPVAVDGDRSEHDAARSDATAVAGAIAGADAVLVADYGAGVTANAAVRGALEPAALERPIVWDPHPRGEVPVPGCRVVTPNAGEAAGMTGRVTDDPVSAVAAARHLVETWRAHAVCVTMGARGAALVSSRGALLLPAPATVVRDVCGAGDRFAAAVAVGLADRVDVTDAVERAVAVATRYVSTPRVVDDVDLDVEGDSDGHGDGHGDGALAVGGSVRDGTGGADADPDVEALLRPSARTGRRRNSSDGRVVATSGCFDLLHAGHVRMLSLSRTLGGRLVVLLNDDDSVRRRKGAGRPVVPADERAELLLALTCVDDVVVFGDDTPERALAALRPDVYAKGADYRLEELPEAPLIASWGGETVILPYEAGRSTTELIARSSRSSVRRS